MRKISADGKNGLPGKRQPGIRPAAERAGRYAFKYPRAKRRQHLLDERYHRDYLDSFGKMGSDIANYKREYDAYRRVLEEAESLSFDESEKERRLDTLQYQIKELKDADIQIGEQETLRARRDLMRNSEKLLEGVNTAFYSIYGGERSGGALELIREAELALSSAGRYAEALSALSGPAL